ncbi:unknown protein [Microcystis aeruginosa NIES-843]|uniref:Uncharacterized protein n=1 Tax=Microcystis aeruginosa (strain NIES-843 / IAM M-2473) TaxID=449447 RepID=B0JVQ3_MICAN|nr:unknown protein [Microcystis aeruginosa NIES-843]
MHSTTSSKKSAGSGGLSGSSRAFLAISASLIPLTFFQSVLPFNFAHCSRVTLVICSSFTVVSPPSTN